MFYKEGELNENQVCSFFEHTAKDGKNVIEPETLIAVTLFIAQSNSKEKEIIIELVMNILLNM